MPHANCYGLYTVRVNTLVHDSCQHLRHALCQGATRSGFSVGDKPPGHLQSGHLAKNATKNDGDVLSAGVLENGDGGIVLLSA